MARHLAGLLVCLVLWFTNTLASDQGKRQTEKPACTSQSDVVFVVDSSEAVSRVNYDKELNFVKQTVNTWNVGPYGVQVGLVTFGSTARGVFNLNSYSTGADVTQAISNAPLVGGQVNIQEGLRFAMDNMFTPQTGVRDQTARVMVLVTNGHSANPALSILQGQTVQNNDIQVYTVGIGAGVDQTELKGIASTPDTRYFYPADTYDAAAALSKIIGPKICNEIPMDPNFLPQVSTHLRKADIVFLLDSSSSIGKDNFHKLEDFLKDVASKLPVSQDGIHVGLMQYSSYPSLEFPLNLYSSRYDVLKAIDRVSYMGGGANTADALQFLRQQVFSQNAGARPGVPRIGIVISDGVSSNSANVAIQADYARLDNIGLLAVGVGPDMNTAELQSIADDPDSAHMFSVSDYDQLPTVIDKLIDAMAAVRATVSPLTSGSSGGTLPPDPCRDAISNCNNYPENTCTEYREWSRANCERHCGFCTPLYTSAPPACDDKLTNCAAYGISSCGGVYLGWAQENCQRFCGYCGPNTQSLGYYSQCYYKGQAYRTGQKWVDGCDYECVCEDGNTGRYRCFNRCPVYYNLPSQCTLVKDPSECCLQPRCYFDQMVNVISGSAIGTVNGIKTCQYKGVDYYEGQQWQDGCDFQCTCTDASTGSYRCHDYCAKYPSMPSYCRGEKDAGSCCARPVCEFAMQQGSFTGLGSVSGHGINNPPATLPPCVDAVDNCAMYGKGACTAYRTWALQTCRLFCELCGVDRDPGPEDLCIFDGKQYSQDQSWFVGSNTICNCEKATQGFYRCNNLCPTYTNVPPNCHEMKVNGSCPVMQCSTGTFYSSSLNYNTIGAGGNIVTGAGTYVAPTLTSGAVAPPGTGGTAAQASAISGCLYKGQVYVEGQLWEDGCDRSCECQNAMTGQYRCRARCPTYSSVPDTCQMVVDESDTCCSKPHCTGPDAAKIVIIPVYGEYHSQMGVAQPPPAKDRFAGTGGYYGPESGMHTIFEFGSTVAPPTAGNFSSGGVGYCQYKGQTYKQTDTWEDGCDYNCVCDNAYNGHYTCVDKCVKYINIPEPYCHLVIDPRNSCCKIPDCLFTAPYGLVTGLATIQPSTGSSHPTSIPATPGFAFCIYNGAHYDHNQVWYQGCDYKCTCEDPAVNKYRCVSRCPAYENLDPACTQEPDPNDPACCSVPRCPTPLPQHTLSPNPTASAVTIPPGFVTGDNSPPGATGSTATGSCEYNGRKYQQGEKWEDACAYNCVCEDATTGRYKCTEKCTRYDSIPEGCRLVSDFANPCCTVLRCNPTLIIPSLVSTVHPDPHSPQTTPSPTAFCIYNGVPYSQGKTWSDGCDKSCRCDNADTGVYTCTQRCMVYDHLPPECKLVTDSRDQCCLVPQCGIPQPSITNAPLPNSQPPTPTVNPYTGSPTPGPVPVVSAGVVYPTPTAVIGKVTGTAYYPPEGTEPGGVTPTPRLLTYCEYKGVQYQQAQTWTDGCDFNCQCVNALQGRYECTERCPRYPNLPPECRLVKNIADPCCEHPECGPAPTLAPTTHAPGSTIAPPEGATTTTLNPNPTTRISPTPADVCVYKGKAYSQGQRWYDGCDYQCVCENGPQGLYTCSDRCPVYQGTLPQYCSMVPAPVDPFCCEVPQCDLPPSFANSTGFIFPTPPLPKIEGGSATPIPTPPPALPSPGSILSTIAPVPGQTTTSPAPTIPSNVCVYGGKTYEQGQRWRDSCSYNCVCDNASAGHYTCTEICPKTPPSLPPRCRLVRDSNNPCCQLPYCDLTAPPTASTMTPPAGVTGVSPSLDHNSNLSPTDIVKVCEYNGVAFRQGQTWQDGCDLSCVCEDASAGYYRCNQRCPRYDHVPTGCVLTTDSRDSCCSVPLCPPVQPLVPVTPSDASTTPPDGSTPIPPSPGDGSIPQSTSSLPFPIPSAIPGKIEGQGMVPTLAPTMEPDPNNPSPSIAPTRASGCLYKGTIYQRGQQWSDGCLYNCVCVDEVSGRYTCTEKCPVYPSIPTYCQLINDPKEPCCKTPQCLPTPILPPTIAPSGSPATPPVGSTVSPPTGPTPIPVSYTTIAPVLTEVCRYADKMYTQGQQWDDGCSKRCVCENAKTGFYRCSDRCANYPVAVGCIMVPDPSDPLCCKVPQCTPTTNPSFASPTPGPTSIVSPPLGIVTGLAPVPTPTAAHPGDITPTPQLGCLYKGNLYRQKQQWQDGCDFNCVCENEVTGLYQCTQRCAPISSVPPRCRLQPDPKDFCCLQQVCDYSQPVPTVFVAPQLGQSSDSPGPSPMSGMSPSPTQVSVCVYQGVAYAQGVSWKEGCSRSCRCDDAANNVYSCFDRCPTYQLQAGCRLVTDPQDTCCQVADCAVLVTPIPTQTSQTSQPTPFPNGSYPIPEVTPSKAPDLIPQFTPSPVPVGIPGIVMGTPPTPTGFCEYKGGHYNTGQTWEDGCDYRCECVDAGTGLYRCTQKCAPYPNIPAYCVMVRDPRDQCCETPYCPGLLVPPTPTPTPIAGNNPTPATGPIISPPPGVTPSSSPTPSSVLPPLFIGNVPVPTGSSNPLPKEICVFMDKAYTQGQQWYDGCDKMCVCEDAKSGFYSCTDRCAQFPDLAPGCIMVPDPKDPSCCQAPQCETTTNPNVPPPGVIGVVQGIGLTPTPTPWTGLSPSVGSHLTQQASTCNYKGTSYSQGQTWQDGCDFNCRCVNATSSLFRCTDRCPRYPNLPTTCVTVYDSNDPCCQKVLCGDNVPTLPPTLVPPTGVSPSVQPTPDPNAFCVYSGVPFRQGQTWNVGCDKVCKCEDPMTRLVTCSDRCPSYPTIGDGCTLKTDPSDSCCQIQDCPVSLVPGTQTLVPPVKGIITGGITPQAVGQVPSFIGAPTDGCVYNGQTYKAGQTWNDACTYTCVCTDSSGKYVCSEKCPRFNNLPATCTLVQDPRDPCCKTANCPDLPVLPAVGTTPSPQPGASTTVPQPTVANVLQDVCVYKGQYYKQGQIWYEGCEQRCRCEDTARNFYRCDDRCSKFPAVPSECTMVPDPQDPVCCKKPECPLLPTGSPSPTTGYLRPSVVPPVGEVTGSGKIPVPTPAQPGQTTLQPLPATGCYYKTLVYQKGQSWDDGCDFTCTCEDEQTGLYHCKDKCSSLISNLPNPDRCRLVQDPLNTCCPVPYCDFSNPTPIFPTLIVTPTIGPDGAMDFNTLPPASGSKPPGFCVYQGVYYRQGDEWNNGCSQRCRCEDVSTGYYTCFDRCKNFENLPKSCSLKTDPSDPCCVIPDCNIYPTPGPPSTSGVSGGTSPPSVLVPVAAVGGTFSGVGGTNPVGLSSNPSNFGGTRTVCVYKSQTYSQGQTWEDGCSYQCECIDAARGQYTCTDKCPAYYFLPSSCYYKDNPSNPCCKFVSCEGTPPPSTISTAPSVSVAVVVTPDTCVYLDGQHYNTGDSWSAGCDATCKCDNGTINKYTCLSRCPAFSSLPTYCYLIPDPQDQCCEAPECDGKLPMVGTNQPTQSPFLPPNVTNVVPLGTHTIVSGTSSLAEISQSSSISGGRSACVYKNREYHQGQFWEDGCDYVCSCEDEATGLYKCITKCPKMPPLPTYCIIVNVPGQCCPSITCDIPGKGRYNPVPELIPSILPPQGPSPSSSPQILVLVDRPHVSGERPQGGGATLPPNIDVGGITDMCVKDGRAYNQGDKWTEGCDYDCECLDGRSGYYECKPKCPTYDNLPKACTLVKQGCCNAVVCTNPDGTTVDLTQTPSAVDVFSVTSVAASGYSGFRAGYQKSQGSFFGASQAACLYKGKVYNTGDKWEDGCDFSCVCEDAATRQFLCKPKCQSYLQIPSTCKRLKDPQGCCEVLDCTVPVTTTPDPACTDSLTNCADYGKVACSGQYEAWARRNCPYYCGYSQCGGEVSTTPGSCVDKLPNCLDYGKDACTGEYIPWAQENCPVYCGMCTTVTTSVGPQCFDLLPDCSSYGASACQKPYIEWAQTNCKKTCSFCGNMAVGAAGSGLSGTSGPIGFVYGQGSEFHSYSQPDTPSSPGSTVPSNETVDLLGWVTLLKGVAGVENDDLFQLWSSTDTRNEDNEMARRPTAEFHGHYKPSLSNYWDQCNFDQVKVSVWNNGEEKVNITFDAQGANKMNWFDPTRIITSTYNDIKSVQFNFFSLQGDVSMGREFYINKQSSGCDGVGWIMASTQSSCFFERTRVAKPTFLYSNAKTSDSWMNLAEGDVFMISGHGGHCGNTSNMRPVCSYDGHDYRTGESWQDGCEKNCTCRDANLGFYQCDDLCRKYQMPLPDGCHLTKLPGQCCETLNCSISSTGGCYYHGHYYPQGQTWDDGCDYKCTCERDIDGFYTCRTKCLSWNLPAQCYLANPPAGKCCPVPTCPAGIVVVYPPGYEQE